MADTQVCVLNETQKIIAATKSDNWKVRLAAVKTICPCKVQRDIEMFWTRIFEMAHSLSQEPQEQVRYQILHTLCDGAPRARETEVIDSIQEFWNDPCDKIKRRARRALESYRRTGDWNIL